MKRTLSNLKEHLLYKKETCSRQMRMSLLDIKTSVLQLKGAYSTQKWALAKGPLIQ